MKYACAIRVITNPGLLAVNQDVLGIQESSKILMKENSAKEVAPPHKLLKLFPFTLSANTAFTAHNASTACTASTPYTSDTYAYVYCCIVRTLWYQAIYVQCVPKMRYY